jgi:exonuclease SbcD
MRFLHLADLHIGKRVNEFSMIEDQKYIFDKILDIIDEKKLEGVLIAGDVYDKPVPSAEAVTLLNNFLNSLSERDLKVFVISGNHDSAERIGFGSKLISFSGVYMAKPFLGTPEKHILKDEFGEIHVYMLPFIKPVMVKHIYEGVEITGYDEAIAYVMKQTEIDENKRNILIAHQFVSGGNRCDSEDISVGGIDEVSVDRFSKFDYVALGHLHGPQHIKSEFIRYSGTPLKYSFSEVNHKKSALIIDMKEKGNISLEKVPLIPLHDMREIRGKYQELMSKDFYKDINKSDYMHITLTDEDDILNALELLRTVYPNIMKLDYDNQRTQSSHEIKGAENVEGKKPIDLFGEFFELQNNQPMNAEQTKFMTEMIEEIWEEDAL